MNAPARYNQKYNKCNGDMGEKRIHLCHVISKSYYRSQSYWVEEKFCSPFWPSSQTHVLLRWILVPNYFEILSWITKLLSEVLCHFLSSNCDLDFEAKDLSASRDRLPCCGEHIYQFISKSYDGWSYWAEMKMEWMNRQEKQYIPIQHSSDGRSIKRAILPILFSKQRIYYSGCTNKLCIENVWKWPNFEHNDIYIPHVPTTSIRRTQKSGR